MNDKRRHVDPERQKQVEQQIMLSYQTQPSQVILKENKFKLKNLKINVLYMYRVVQKKLYDVI